MKTKAKKSSDKSKVSPKQGANAGIWHAMDWTDCHVGYLVTLPNDIDRPLAFIDISVGLAGAKPVELAKKILRDASRAWRDPGQDGHVVDLRNCSSRAPFPRFIFSLRCVPMGDDGLPIEAEPIEPTPFCQFLFNELSERAINLASDADAQRLQAPKFARRK